MLNSIYNTLKRNIGIYKDSKAFMTEVWVALLIQLPLIWIMGEIQERASPHMNCTVGGFSVEHTAAKPP